MKQKTSKNKVYSLHAPEAYYLSKGNARNPYEFGCKVSLIITHKQGVALCAQALAENKYDGHILKDSLSKAKEIAGCAISSVFVDKGYKGRGVTDCAVYISGQRRDMTRYLKKQLKRRAAIEPHIGHMKSEGKLRRNFLKGTLGDALNALLGAIGHNTQLIWKTIRSFWALFFELFLAQLWTIILTPKYKTTSTVLRYLS